MGTDFILYKKSVTLRRLRKFLGASLGSVKCSDPGPDQSKIDDSILIFLLLFWTFFVYTDKTDFCIHKRDRLLHYHYYYPSLIW